MTHSDLVYGNCGTYVEVALCYTNVSSEQLIRNVAERVRDDIMSIKLVPWPPRVEELEEEEELSRLTLQLLSALRRKKRVDLSPPTLSLSLSPLSSHSTSSSDPPLPPSMPPTPFTG